MAAILPAGCGSSHERSPTGAARTPHVVKGPRPPAVKQTVPLEIPTGQGHLAAMSRSRGLVLRDRPHGHVIAHLRPKTAYGSPTVVWAAVERGRWLGVFAPALPNNRLGWLDVDHDKPLMWRETYSIVADLSARDVVLRHDGRVVRRIPVSIGHPDTPTPLGKFAVTDKLITEGPTAYGCCILALSGHQPHLRPGWAGGDRIAIHGSPGQLVGQAASAGCLRARDKDLRYLLKRVPLGTPVLIQA
jgi:L,D-transpeptidase catalytic domain